MVAIIPIDKQTKFSQQSLKGRDGDVIAQYDHLCYIWKLHHLVPEYSGCIDSKSDLLLGKTLLSI